RDTPGHRRRRTLLRAPRSLCDGRRPGQGGPGIQDVALDDPATGAVETLLERDLHEATCRGTHSAQCRRQISRGALRSALGSGHQEVTAKRILLGRLLLWSAE